MDDFIKDTGSTIAAQRELVLQRLAGTHARLEKNGVGASFYRVAKDDPVGDMGFLGSLILHGIVSGPLEELLAEYHLPALTGDLSSTFLVGSMEGVSLLNETEDRHRCRPRSAFYPLGRRNKAAIKDARKGKKFNLASAVRNARFSYEVQAELAGMFELTDLLIKLKEQIAEELSLDERRQVHLVLRKSSPARHSVERRRQTRHEGLYNA